MPRIDPLTPPVPVLATSQEDTTERRPPEVVEREERAEQRRMFVLTAICFVSLVTGWMADGANLLPEWGIIGCYIIAYISGGWYPVLGMMAALRQRTLDVNLLMVLAALGAAAVSQWREGAILMFLFSLSGALEHYAMGRSRHAIRALMKLSPEEALVRRDGVERVMPVEELIVGDCVIVRPGERIPADGTVLAGVTSVDQAPITGESIPVPKTPGSSVFAATINGDGALEIAVTRLAGESTLARVIRMVEEAQAEQTPTQRMTEWIGTRYTMGVLIVVGLFIVVPPLLFGAPFAASFYRAMTLMTVASPCALVISTPAAILSGIAAAARCGILFKGGGALEELGRVNAIAFDKTGTLTRGTPEITDLVPAPGIGSDRLLAVAAAIERHSEHPLAHAVLASATEHELVLPHASGFRAIVGNGVEAAIAGESARVGTPALLADADVVVPDDALSRAEALEAAGKTVVFVSEGTCYLGCIALADTLRPAAQGVIATLRRLGVQHTVMLSGDNTRVARVIATALGLDGVRAELLPEEKLTAIHELRERYGVVAMVGDGVNDAPALAAASVGIAMGGAGTDVALETADVALMGDDLTSLADGVDISRHARRIVRQNVTIALGVIAILAPIAAFGLIRLPVGVVGHELSTLVVVANGLRLLVVRRPHTVQKGGV
jgi:Cd2+/Zn2+-exporting ATPase